MISPELHALFRDPPRDFGPTPLWWWSGAKVTRERLAWQMRKFTEGGVHNLVVINLAPAGPSFGARADDPAWFGEEWWARFTDACEIAQELGTRLWFYDQLGFSGANVQGGITHRHPEAAGRALRSRRGVVGAGRVALLGTETLVGAYRANGERLATTAPDRVGAADGTEVRIVTAVPTAFDYLDARAAGLLLRTVHHEFDRRVPQYLGNVIAGSFQDELPGTNSWTRRFPEEFAARRGYDLLDHLPALFGDDGTLRTDGLHHAAKVRTDYYAVRTELTEEALFRPLAAWHDERGMLLGADQSNPARAGFPTQATQIYSDYFRTHRWYSAAGSDHEGDAKIHSSMAHLYGHDRVWIEAFHSSGWGGTLEDTYDWLLPFLRSGANLYNPHASYFGTAGGWFEWAPPSTDWRQPYWKQYPAFSRAVARIASVMSWGTYSAEVAVLHPTTTAQALLPLDVPVAHFGDGQLGAGHTELDLAQRHYLELCGTNNWFATRLGALDRARVSFDVIDDASVQRAEAVDGALRVRDLGYSVVLLPSASVLEEDTARRLRALLDSGGRVVVVGRAPSYAAGVRGDDASVAALVAHPRLEYADDAEAAAKAVGDAAGHATGDVPLLVRRKGAEGAAFVTGAFPNASAYPLREGAWLWEDYDFDPARYATVSSVRVNAVVAEAEVWNPATGAREAAPVTLRGGTSTITVPLRGAPAAIVVWREEPPEGPGEETAQEAPEREGTAGARPREDAAAGAPRTPVSPRARAVPHAGPDACAEARDVSVTDLSTGWRGRLVPTMDNTWGDLALPAGAPVDAVPLWTLRWAEGKDVEGGVGEPAGTVRATYGNRVRVLGPVAAERAPAPLDGDEADAVLTGARPLVPAREAWATSLHSTSRGILDPGHGALGNKGMVDEEFVRVAAPGEGAVVRVRTVVETDRLGPADLVLGSPAAKRWWWNGRELLPGGDYLATARIEVRRPRNVLEYELADPEIASAAATTRRSATLGSFFCLAPPGGFAPRPQFMRLPGTERPDGRVTYRGRLALDRDAIEAVLVVGAATGVTVTLDGAVVARQEKVEYYESSWGAQPMYFRHALPLSAGEHVVEVVADSVRADDVVFVDLVARTDAPPGTGTSPGTDGGATALVSGAGWEVETAGRRGRTVEHRGRWAETQSSYAAVRPHPLSGTEWLTGAPVLGTRVDTVRTTDDVVPAAQRFRITLPVGAVSVDLPLALPATVRLDGVAQPVTDGVLDFGGPLEARAELDVVTEPTAVLRGGSAWSGPVSVRTAETGFPLGDWRACLGLAGWSGGVVHSRTLRVPAGPDPVLDLGRVRGSVEVTVDGEPAGEAFCAPYRFRLRGTAGRTVRLEVTVYNTLAPFLHETTPTAWTFPSQLVSGLLGPVTLRTPRAAE
ncbi:glycosyl hydrolase [Streptomyces hebeiensis]|uniref:glycosyl hydrolase n=1 Tax=Streptomyces hebeiensis TaxID=229486 RepID=UPI0031D7EB84